MHVIVLPRYKPTTPGADTKHIVLSDIIYSKINICMRMDIKQTQTVREHFRTYLWCVSRDEAPAQRRTKKAESHKIN